MGICGSLMDIFDYPKRKAQIKYLFFDYLQARSANIDIYDCHSISIAMIVVLCISVIEANG